MPQVRGMDEWKDKSVTAERIVSDIQKPRGAAGHEEPHSTSQALQARGGVPPRGPGHGSGQDPAPAKTQLAGSQEAISPSSPHFQDCILNL